MERVILHSDLNCFYTSVECLHHPEIRGKPVAVAGDPEQRHGIILTANYVAKGMGVKTGQAIWQAKQFCPDLVVLPPDYNQYLRFSREVRRIYMDYTDLVESFGIDEAWLDVSGSTGLFGNGERIANEIRRRIWEELGITASIGVSYNKIFAKLGSDYKKPNATTVISRENYREIVWPLPAKDLLYVGPATSKKLAGRGIQTIGQVANMNPQALGLWLGKWGKMLWQFANGYDNSLVTVLDSVIPVKSVGNSATTPRDLTSAKDVHMALYILSDSVAERLRDQKSRGRVVSISMRDTDLYTFSRQTTLRYPSCLTDEIAGTAFELFTKHYNWSTPIRSLGVSVSDLSSENAALQLDFYGNQLSREKKEKLERTVDWLRTRYGHACVQRGVTLTDPLFAQMNPKGDHIIHPTSYLKSGSHAG